MNVDAIDRTNEPTTDEFEKLEFLPEEPVQTAPESSDTAEIDFTPETELADEPPVSFSPVADVEPDIQDGFDDGSAADLDFGASTPFELFGTSLVDDADLDDDIDPLDDLGF